MFLLAFTIALNQSKIFHLVRKGTIKIATLRALFFFFFFLMHAHIGNTLIHITKQFMLRYHSQLYCTIFHCSVFFKGENLLHLPFFKKIINLSSNKFPFLLFTAVKAKKSLKLFNFLNFILVLYCSKK